ncbi:hypothetical protein CONCODRAFT_47121 [Conidiobolus coronatus NRRL 28638]|uniref:Guanine nucleotide-binding protein subunit gamma n=1 Tax=Conidiobolus coronatus (strain ATCC 28846 / CBS 209.66 / NRRL 28638) TaxID=796925 RepID=A0A137PDD1_CONC2|nr:hypothetical protein CONCODRAFT_47121 [Conidiobolus coronatus NRRL 28638]|eukprot:KXN73014.1 hypothetical protein CONCODRAFT_47121 [Conidiobolus coronatus NRRL 28638]
MNAVSEHRLKKLLDQTERLKQQLSLPRVTVSEASQSLIKFATTTVDPLLPSIWGSQAGNNPLNAQSGGCCSIA